MVLIQKSIIWLIILFVFSCGEQETVRIGVMMTLSGPDSALGVNGRGGVLLAHDLKEEFLGPTELNLDLVVFDDYGEPAAIAEILNTAEDQGIRFLIGPLTSNLSEVLLQELQRRELLVISPTITSPHVSGKDDQFLRTNESSTVQGQVLAHRAIEDGYSKMAIIYDHRNEAYTSGVLDGVRSTPIQVVYENGLDGDVLDYVRLAEKVEDSGADSLIFVTSSLPAAALAQQLRNQGTRLGLYGSQWTGTSDIIQRGGRAVEGCIFYGNYYSQENSENYKLFQAAYQKAYGKDPDFVAENSFESVLILLEALLATDRRDVQSVKKYIIEKSDFFLLNSPISIDAYGDAQRYYSLLQIQEGHFVPIYP
jgi:branched-chain amino acid transport system substrate-binding protein